MKIKKDAIYLVTGASGFLGEELVSEILRVGGIVRAFSRNEGKLISLKQKFPSIEIYSGDVSDSFEIKQACKNISGIFHLAASKHVGLAETFPRECTKTNVIGSINILEESLLVKPEFVIGISTDKAAQVSGVYGASKLLMERLFCQYENLNEETEYRIVRYGNVLYSTGSVLCKLRSLFEKGEEVVVTDPSATRFFWTRKQAVELIFSCLENSKNSSPWVPHMKAMSIGDLLDALSRKYLPSGCPLKSKTIGFQPGENKHEKILEEGPFSNEVDRFTVEEIMELI